VIHSSNKLTLLQRKIANALLFNAYHALQEKEEHTIHISTLCDIIGYDSHDHKSIKCALVNLLSTVLEWNLVDGERLDSVGTWNASSIIADASIHGAICTYSYSKRRRQVLYRPNMYGRLDMSVQAKFKSSYGLALYENCNRFQDIGQTPWFDLLKFRKLMGVADNQYKIFRDFKTRVLDKAIEEVNQYAAFIISPQLQKQNRRVTSIQFVIKKPEVVTMTEAVTSVAEPLSKRLTSQFGFSLKQAQDALLKYDEAYILEKINVVQNAASFKNGRVKNVARYLLSALRDDYQPAKASQEVREKITVSNISNKKKAIKDKVTLVTEFKRYQDKTLFSLFNALPKRSQGSILKKFEKVLTGMYQHVYVRSGLENLLVQEQLCQYLRQTQHAVTEKLLSYEAWVARFSEG